MSITVFSIDDDKVITGKFITAATDYRFAIERLVALIDKLDIQRKLQDTKFYRRLERDLVKGCIMPPLTLAFILDPASMEQVDLAIYINENIDGAFVLDGIQRLNTLDRTARNHSTLDLSRPLFLNIIICHSMDNLLYRMITLNNGQKAMTARHQIEILASNVYNFDDLPLFTQTEKDRNRKVIKGSFNKADIVKAYIAFLSDSTNIDNQKIIEEKMDELIADKILNSNITDDNLEFSEIISLINRLVEEPNLARWFKVNNNLIGFAVGIRKSYEYLRDVEVEEFNNAIEIFERAFSSFDVSKVRLGQQRRRLVDYFIANYNVLSDKDENDLLFTLSEVA